LLTAYYVATKVTVHAIGKDGKAPWWALAVDLPARSGR
jgi:hypothetical protein